MKEVEKRGHPGTFFFPANEVTLRNPDVHYPFRQESNFQYLSGFDEPGSCLVIASMPQRGGYKSVLFVQRRDELMEMWEGERYGVDRAVSVFGVDEAYVMEEFDQRVMDLMRGPREVYYRQGLNPKWDQRILSVVDRHRTSQGRSGRSMAAIRDPQEIVGEMRLFKSAEEVEIMRRAGRVTALAHKTAMQEVRPGMNEFEVEALIDYVLRKNGCKRVGYGSIVAGGVNATCLHYTSNNEVLRDGDLLLIDAGGEMDHYTADITRTFPVGRTFSAAQAKAYDVVLKAQQAGLDMAKPGATMTGIHQHVSEVLADGLCSLGLLKGKPEELVTSQQIKRFYPHGTGHWLGMDVHDVGLYQVNGEPRKLEPGMAFTIEPGFYVQPRDKDAPAEYHRIGIRIEDDVVVTATGCENLTADVPKSRDEIEALRKF